MQDENFFFLSSVKKLATRHPHSCIRKSLENASMQLTKQIKPITFFWALSKISHLWKVELVVFLSACVRDFRWPPETPILRHSKFFCRCELFGNFLIQQAGTRVAKNIFGLSPKDFSSSEPPKCCECKALVLHLKISTFCQQERKEICFVLLNVRN